MASAVASGGTITFTADPGNEAIARSEVTAVSPGDPVTFQFEVKRAGLILRVGSSAGGQDIVSDRFFPVGLHVFTFTPGVSPYHVDWLKRSRGVAELSGFQSVASGVLELGSVFEQEDINHIRYAQSLNALWLTDSRGIKEPQVLQRRALDSWSLVPFRPDNGPFGPRNGTDITLTPDGRQDTVTVTSSQALFRAEDAGGLIRLEHPGQVEIEDFTAPDQNTDEIRVTGIEDSRAFTITIGGTFTGPIALERSVGNTLSWQQVRTFFSATSIRYDDTYDNQVIFYRLRSLTGFSGTAAVELDYGSGFTEGIGRIVSVEADNEVVVDVIEPFAKAVATSIWTFGAWSPRFGYPQAVGLEDGRLYFQRGNVYWGSASDDFENYALGPMDGDAVSRSMGGRMNSIRWLRGVNGSLLAGTRGAEAVVGSNAFGEVVTPSNVQSRIVTNRGSADANPELMDDRVAFISRNGKRIYSFGEGTELPPTMHLTRLHRDLGRRSTFRQLGYSQEEESRLWAVQEDGQVACLVYDIEEGVFGFWRYKVNGRVRSVCCLPGEDEDTVLFVVEREIGGELQYSVERLSDEHWDDSAEVCRLHGAVRYYGGATSALSNLGHLEGRDVHVWNGRSQGPYRVEDGAITLDTPVTQAVVGELYVGKYKSARINMGQMAAFKSISRLAFWVNRTIAGSFTWGRNFDRMDRHKERRDRVLDGPLEIVTEDNEFPFEGSNERDATVCIAMDTPGPCEILALGPMVKENGR